MDLAELRARRSSVVQRHPWELTRQRVIQFLLVQNGRAQPEANHVFVDIGCGDAFVLQQLSQHFPASSFYGIDTALDASAIAQLQGVGLSNQIHLYQNLDQLPSDLFQACDFLLLLDVIEHIADDEDFLRHLAKRSFIGAQTQMLVTVPAYHSLFCSHDRFLGHYRRYTKKSLEQLMLRTGWHTIGSGYFFCSLLLPRLLQRVKEAVRPAATPTTGLVGWNQPHWLSAIFSAMLWMDFRVGYWFQQGLSVPLPGLSAYALATPKAHAKSSYYVISAQ